MFYHSRFNIICILYGLAHHEAPLFTKKKHNTVSVRVLKAPERVFGNCILTNL